MAWKVVHCDEFNAEFQNFPDDLQDELLAHEALLAEFGPGLGRPTVDTLKGSKLTNLKELRFSWQRLPYRFLFVFDPSRRAIILVGGSKGNDKQFYSRMTAIAEQRFVTFLQKEEENERNA